MTEDVFPAADDYRRVTDFAGACPLIPDPFPFSDTGDVFPSQVRPITGAPFDYDIFPDGCVCHLRDDIDRGEVFVAPPGGCPVHTPWAFPGYSLAAEVVKPCLPVPCPPWTSNQEPTLNDPTETDCVCLRSANGEVVYHPPTGCPVHSPWLILARSVTRENRGPGDAAAFEAAASGRHHNTVHLARQFSWAHLPPRLQDVSAPVGQLVMEMIWALPDGIELTAGLRKLLEAKDCLVRAAL